VIEGLISEFARHSPGFYDELLLVDSTPVECARSLETVKRGGTSSLADALANAADYGYCASHSRFFWGFRPHALFALDGTPRALALTSPKIERSSSACKWARLMVHRGDSLAWAGLTVLEPNVGPTFRKAIYDRAVESRTTFAEALLAARPDDFDGMTGATPRRANDLIDRTLAWLDAHPVPGGEGIPERWGDWLLLAFSVADAPAPVSDELVALLGIVDDAVEVGVDLPASSGRSSRSPRTTRAHRPAASGS
jgi:hypothetical protein